MKTQKPVDLSGAYSGSSGSVQSTDAVASQRMDPELKAKWVAALRSGEYAQCRYKLHDSHGYCCLGVLSRLMGYSSADLIGLESNGLPDVRNAVQGNGDMFGICAELADKNDGTNGEDAHTFPEIADYIEENL